jgi:hypothetical protein
MNKTRLQILLLVGGHRGSAVRAGSAMSRRQALREQAPFFGPLDVRAHDQKLPRSPMKKPAEAGFVWSEQRSGLLALARGGQADEAQA